MDISRGYNTHDVDGFVRGIGGMGTMLARQPYLSAQAGLLQQRRGLYEQQAAAAAERARLYQAQQGMATGHGDLYRSQAAKADAETKNIIRLGEAAKFLQDHGGEAERALANGDTDNPIVNQVHAASQAVMGLKGRDLSVPEKK